MLLDNASTQDGGGGIHLLGFLIHAFDVMTAKVYRTTLQKVENTDGLCREN